MKPWPSTSRTAPDRAAAREYLGRTPEEALAKATAALGPAADLRCWKTRRGGVGGFFATEVYVASSTPPRGAESSPGRPRRRPTDGTARAHPPAAPEPADPAEAAEAAEAASPATEDRSDPLATLAEGTTDHVSIHNQVLPAAAFDALLAEAEAALGHDLALAAESPGASALTPVPAPPSTPSPAPIESASPAADVITPDRQADAGSMPVGPEWIPDLRSRLRTLGVPDAYLPRSERPTLDALACALDDMPDAPRVGAAPGEIVVVVGSDDLVHQTADMLVGTLGLGRRDVVRCTVPAPDSEPDGATRGGAAKVNAAVRVAKRRAAGSTSLVTLATATGSEGAAAAADVIDCLRPHVVLAAVDATRKRADVERWLEQLGTVDALAVWGLDRTRTPGELLGAAPIAYADGTACTAVSWTATLLAHLAAESPA
jgi:hypothetical protein